MLHDIARYLRDYESSRWDVFPEFDLYMEQLLGCAGRPLDFNGLHLEGAEEQELTAHRVNNYVKQGIIPPPEGRRYSREHLSRLYILRMLKGMLSLPLLSKTIEGLIEREGARTVSERYAALQDAAIAQVACDLEERLDFTDETEASSLDYLALALAAEARILSLVSETIMRRRTQSENHRE